MRLVLIETDASGDEVGVRYAWLEDLCLDVDAGDEADDLATEFARRH